MDRGAPQHDCSRHARAGRVVSSLEYWIGALILASIRRAHNAGFWGIAHQRFYDGKGGYRSLRFKLHSHAFHARGVS